MSNFWTNLLIIPDFGVKADSEGMVALKEALEAKDCDVKFLEVSGDPREAAKLVEQSVETEDSPTYIDDLVPPVDDRAHLMVVFGLSAMLCGGVRRGMDILFINPSYTTDGEWRIQYYKDRDKADLFREMEWGKKYEEKELLPSGLIVTRSYVPSRRTAIFSGYIEGGDIFNDRYWHQSVIDPKISDPAYLAQNIHDFACRNWRLPMDEVNEAVNDLPRKCVFKDGIFEGIPFPEPIRIGNEIVTGLTIGVPMANGQSGTKILIEGYKYPLPLERYGERDDQLKLRDAIRGLAAKLEAEGVVRKKILIVPDYLQDYPNPTVRYLSEKLKKWGYKVVVAKKAKNLEESRAAIERHCAKVKYDMIVTLDSEEGIEELCKQIRKKLDFE